MEDIWERHLLREEKESIYGKLIEAGSISIAKYGFKKTSIDDIAKKVGISKGGIL